MIFKGYLFGILYGVLCLGLGFAFSGIPGCSKKITRKIVHILIGAEWIILNYFFGPSIHLLIICLLFLLLLMLTYKKKLIPIISSDGDNAPGTVYYALAMSIMSLVCLILPDMLVPFGIGVFCTSLGDGLAGLMGQLHDPDRFAFNKRIYGNKTIFGCGYNLIISTLVAHTFNFCFGLDMSLWHCLAIGFLSTLLEMITGRGFDNVTVTLGTSFLAYFFINHPEAGSYIAPILITPVMIALVNKKKALTKGGIVAAVIVDAIISISLGNFGFVTLLTFFALGIVTDKIKKYGKKSRQNDEKAQNLYDSSRNHLQVLANAIIGSICAFLYLLTRERVFVICFVASFAEALADTFASGIGALSSRAFDPFRMRKCTPGLSGGMSVIGTLASVIGGLIIALLSMLFGAVSIIEALIIASAAFLGAVFDSMLGSLLQIKYRCASCGVITEREEHCGGKTIKYSGIRLINNDAVNLLSTIFSSVLAGIGFLLILG